MLGRAVAAFLGGDASGIATLGSGAAKAKGNRIPYGGMSNPKDVDGLIAYLMTLK